MKQKDIMLIAVVVIISAVISIALSKMLISSPKNRSQKVQNVEAISADFPEVNKKYFNKDSIDPTLIISISGNSNDQPFNTKR